MKNQKGSILEEFGRVTGVDDPTTTGLRRTVDAHVQTDYNMKLRSKAITQHSSEVGEKHYHKVAPEIRASALHHINIIEGVEIQTKKPLTKETALKRAKLNDGDRETAAANAREVLRKSKRNVNVKVGGRCNLDPKDRIYLQKDVFGVNGELCGVFDYKKTFPGGSCQ